MKVEATVRLLDGEIAGAMNLRDLGGHATAGGRVRPGRVYRSAMMHHITAEGLAALAGRHGVRAVFDLRARSELTNDGVAGFDAVGIRHHHTPVFENLLGEQPGDRRARFDSMAAGTFDWPGEYLLMLGAGGPAFRAVFERLSEGEHPAVFHCSAGRDRTGVTAALLLGVLGVPDETIAADYALTTDFLRPHVRRFIRPASSAWLTEELMARVLVTRAEWMHTFLDALRAAHGTIEGYVRATGVSDATLSAVRDLLHEDAPVSA